MGAGKTSVGRRVAELAGTYFSDLDRAVERGCGMTVAEIFSTQGEAAFRAAEAAALPEALDGDGVVALGGGTPLHDPSWAVIRREAVSVFLDAPFELLWSRIGAEAGRPLVERGREELAALLESRLPRYREADHTVDAAPDVDTVARAVLAAWSA